MLSILKIKSGHHCSGHGHQREKKLPHACTKQPQLPQLRAGIEFYSLRKKKKFFFWAVGNFGFRTAVTLDVILVFNVIEATTFPLLHTSSLEKPFDSISLNHIVWFCHCHRNRKPICACVFVQSRRLLIYR